MKRKILVFLALLSLLMALIWNFHKELHTPFVSQEKKIYFISGTKTWDILSILEKEGVIPSKWPLILDIIINPKHSSLKHGEYKFEKDMTPFDVMEKISKGEVIVYKVTIPEGLTSFDIVERLKKEDKLEGEVISIPEEGVLFPSTYEYKRGQTRASLIERMRKEMDKVLKELSDQYPASNIKEKIIMASLVEKETSLDIERPRIAGVFYHRLEKKMRLQCDPTVIYALTQGKELFARSLTKTDLKTESPFNTYRVQGLPPAPICNPGKASLLAAFSPLKTDELYFVLKKGREHEFSHSLINHNKAVQNLRRLEKGNTQ